jgi:hypothetical protein
MRYLPKTYHIDKLINTVGLCGKGSFKLIEIEEQDIYENDIDVYSKENIKNTLNYYLEKGYTLKKSIALTKIKIERLLCKKCLDYSKYRFEDVRVICSNCSTIKVNKFIKNKVKTNEVFKFSQNIRSLIGSSFRRGKNKYHKSIKTEKILGCTIDEFIKHIESQFTKGMTLENHGEWHLDHIIPLASADTEEDVIRLNHYTNFQPLWAKDNLSKGCKIITD